MDYYTKLFKYRTAGIREYWIVDPSKNLVVVYNFELGKTEQYTLQDSIKVGIYDGPVQEMFYEERVDRRKNCLQHWRWWTPALYVILQCLVKKLSE